jgi:hypothetical protein
MRSANRPLRGLQFQEYALMVSWLLFALHVGIAVCYLWIALEG